MAFFPRAFYNNQDSRSFTPLFRLLDDFDSYSRQCNPKASRHSAISHWQPKFDIRETAGSYELHGELPGVKKEHVNIEFTGPQTLQIRGKVERTYSAGTHPTGHVEDAAVSGALSAAEDQKKSKRATVEDDDEEWTNADHSAPGTPSTSTAEVSKSADAKNPADHAKYWLSERSVGEFSRAFTFPDRVDQDQVSAGFQDGILNIVVPKAKKHESRRITIN